MRIHGRCHCGNIAFDLDWPGEPAEIPARACGCTFCRKHGGVWTSHPAAALQVHVEDVERVSEYRFGTGTATFHVCARCGAVPLVTSRIDARTYAVVNVNCFEGVDPSLLAGADADFEGEDTAARLQRRRRYWIGHVEMTDALA